MRILITNDDGIDAPGIKLLRDLALELTQDVWVVAPDGNRSGVGHAITFGRELVPQEVGDKQFALNGTPADCVIFGTKHLMRTHRPDIVLSGVNDGQNIGDLSHPSGTVAGAREGCLQGALGIALSQSVDYYSGKGVDFSATIAHGLEIIRLLIGMPRHRDVFYNVNFPRGEEKDWAGPKATLPQRFEQSMFDIYPSDNDGKYFLGIELDQDVLHPEYDVHALLHQQHAVIASMGLNHDAAAHVLSAHQMVQARLIAQKNI